MKPFPALVVVLLFTLAPPAVVHAEPKTLAEYSWQTLSQEGWLKTGIVEESPGRRGGALKIENPGPKALTATVLVIDSPAITGKFYSLSGEVRYEGVEGEGYLEMWNHFAEDEAYFSRTRGESGPMGKLSGTSDWRGFWLPFNSEGTEGRPSRLVINVFLPARGTVWLGSPLKLKEGGFEATPGEWWSVTALNLVGALGGALGGVLGALTAWLTSRGKARGFVLALQWTMLGLGVLALVAGLVALALRQPWHVPAPLLLLGAILVTVSPVVLSQCRRRYREMELRRMAALDAA